MSNPIDPKTVIPPFEGGVPAEGFYNAGPVLADDTRWTTPEDAIMKIYAQTAQEDFARYVRILEAAGFEDLWINENAAFSAVSGHCDGAQVYAYRTKATGEVRLICETEASTPVTKISRGVGQGTEEICQYALYYDPENGHSSTTTNCGMFYAVKLADSSLFLIDGGDELQCSDEAVAGMLAFLREFSGVAEGEKIRISGWFFTHAHGDHMAACIRLLRTYPDAFILDGVYLNFPSSSVARGDSEKILLMDTLREFKERDAAVVKLHTGMTFSLAGTRFDVLYTHEDAVKPENPSVYPFRDFNCTSTVLKMTTKSGGSVMWLGDTNVETEALVAKTVPAELWKSDVVQIAHHCFNYLSTLYPMIDANWAMLPNSVFGGHTPENDPKRREVEAVLADPANLWYEDKTTVFRFEDGQYKVVRELDRVGGEHDGTDLLGRKHPVN
ncbi:MAG: hypothetical protein E7576_02910 [Ruminococcaceae bacterium]|jgi:phosphoribosyl 1,2-cyclic phosphodiesterase|nr:hypothetical protein [Oscillospiraceae bacterium]